MRLVIHHHIPEDPAFRDQWNRLVYAMERPEVFYTWEWARAVSRAYTSSLRPLLFAAYRNDSLAGLAAMARDAGGGAGFLAATTADYCDFVSAPADRQELIGLVMRELSGMGSAEVRLASLPADSASAPLLRNAVRMSGYSVFARPAYFCAQITLKTQEEREQIARSARRNSKRTRKALAEIGAVAVDHTGTQEKFTEEFPGLAVASIARLLTAGRISNLVGRERRTFLEELFQLLSAQGALALSTLKVGGRTVAWHYGFQYAGVWFWYLPAFDAKLQHLRPGPGSCLFYEVLLQASENPDIHTVDLGLGDEGYKERYANSGRHTLYVIANRSKARLAREVCRHKVANFVTRYPAVEARVRRSLAPISSIRTQFARKGILRSIPYCFSRARNAFFHDAEATFLQWAPQDLIQGEVALHLQPLSIDLLAVAAMEYEAEPGTREYLLRSASRLQTAGAEGYALVRAGSIPVHFCWVAPFEGFQMRELGHALKEPSAGAVLLFDCWTPGSLRGQGHYARCASLVAELVVGGGKRPWIFSISPNSTSGLERCGFVRRFSIVGKKKLFFSRTAQVEFEDNSRSSMGLYPAA